MLILEFIFSQTREILTIRKIFTIGHRISAVVTYKPFSLIIKNFITTSYTTEIHTHYVHILNSEDLRLHSTLTGRCEYPQYTIPLVKNVATHQLCVRIMCFAYHGSTSNEACTPIKSSAHIKVLIREEFEPILS